MGKLKEWADDQRDYIKIGDGEEVTVTYLDCKIIPNPLGDGETVCYTFDVAGKEKTFNSMSARLADQMDGLKKGTVITISRHGVARQTSYDVVVGENVKPDEVEI